MEPDAFSKLFGEAIFKGFFQGVWIFFKTAWWVIPVVIVLIWFEKWANRKIDIWKRRRKNRKFRPKLRKIYEGK